MRIFSIEEWRQIIHGKQKMLQAIYNSSKCNDVHISYDRMKDDGVSIVDWVEKNVRGHCFAVVEKYHAKVKLPADIKNYEDLLRETEDEINDIKNEIESIQGTISKMNIISRLGDTKAEYEQKIEFLIDDLSCLEEAYDEYDTIVMDGYKTERKLIHECVFYFADKDDAIKFKLVWGGGSDG